MIQMGTSDPRRTLTSEESWGLELEARFDHHEEDMSHAEDDLEDDE